VGNITLEQARAVAAAALQRAGEIDSPSTVAVVDAGRNLVTLERQDDAILASLDVAVAKAHTAASLRMGTAELAAAVQPGGPLYGLPPSFIAFGGGQPLIVDGALVGAVGVSGGSPDQDDDIAAAAARALDKVAA
jgi:uncharacterized protein GlcG (DUF336 family)